MTDKGLALLLRVSYLQRFHKAFGVIADERLNSGGTCGLPSLHPEAYG